MTRATCLSARGRPHAESVRLADRLAGDRAGTARLGDLSRQRHRLAHAGAYGRSVRYAHRRAAASVPGAPPPGVAKGRPRLVEAMGDLCGDRRGRAVRRRVLAGKTVAESAGLIRVGQLALDHRGPHAVAAAVVGGRGAAGAPLPRIEPLPARPAVCRREPRLRHALCCAAGWPGAGPLCRRNLVSPAVLAAVDRVGHNRRKRGPGAGHALGHPTAAA